jgi:hypothetical protein
LYADGCGPVDPEEADKVDKALRRGKYQDGIIKNDINKKVMEFISKGNGNG